MQLFFLQRRPTMLAGSGQFHKIISHNNNHVVARAVVFARSSRGYPVLSVFLSFSVQ